MTDRRSIDSLSINELEQLLFQRRQRARLAGRYPRKGGEASPFVQPVRRAPVSRRQKLLDFLLLLAELGVAAGLIYVTYSGLKSLKTLNQEAAAALALPTLVPPRPTPLIGLAVLPDGHEPPTAAGDAQWLEESDLPAGISFLVTPLPPLPPRPPPTPEPGSPRRMVIPAINIEAPVVQGVEAEQLKLGIGQVPNTSWPGQVGNSVFAAHNDIYGELFRHLDQLEPGDEVFLHTATRSYRYVVRGWKIVEPTEVKVMEPTPTATLTLISCYPYLVDTQRIVVFADLAGETVHY